MKKTEKKSVQKSQNDISSSDQAVVLNAIKDSLLLQKSEILNRDTEFKNSQSLSSRFSDESDQTVQELQNNLTIHLHDRERKSLLLIEKTLSKFSDNTYGDCESCGDQIGFKRLQARPMATLCIACMEDLEDSANTSSHLFQ